MPNTADEAMAAPTLTLAPASTDDTANDSDSGDNSNNNNNSADGVGCGDAPSKRMTRARGAGRPPRKSGTALAKNHPTYEGMIRAALLAQQDKKSSSRVAILKYIMQSYQVGGNLNLVNAHLRQGLKRGVASGMLKQVNGTGATGSFRLADAKSENVKTAKKPAGRKPVSAPALVPAARKAVSTPVSVAANIKPPTLKKAVQSKTTKKERQDRVPKKLVAKPSPIKNSAKKSKKVVKSKKTSETGAAASSAKEKATSKTMRRKGKKVRA